MRLILTGAGGFIGASVVGQLLGAGVEVHTLGRRQVPDTVFHRCDLLADDATSILAAIRPTHLLHLAWNEDRATLWNGAENLAWVAATLRLALAFAQAGGTRAVIAGSSAEYDWMGDAPLDEATSPLDPATGYGRAKRALFDLLTGTPALGLSVGWARIFFAFGPHDKPDRLLSQVIDGVAAGRAVACSQGTQVRPFMHVEDVAGALIALLRVAVEGPVNIALDETMSVRDLALCGGRAAGDASRIAFGTQPLQPREPRVLKAKVSRLTDEVGFVPRYSIASGVAAAVAARLASNKTSKQPVIPRVIDIDTSTP